MTQMNSVASHFLADEASTVDFGRALALATQADAGARGKGGIIYLQGDLGAGKTTLSRGFLRGYGHEGPVKSPTYTLVEPYELENHNIYHFDLYRLADPEEFEYLGAEQYFEVPNVCLIEWAERGAGWVPQADLMVELVESTEGEIHGRKVSCFASTPRGHAILDSLIA